MKTKTTIKLISITCIGLLIITSCSKKDTTTPSTSTPTVPNYPNDTLCGWYRFINPDSILSRNEWEGCYIVRRGTQYWITDVSFWNENGDTAMVKVKFNGNTITVPEQQTGPNQLTVANGNFKFGKVTPKLEITGLYFDIQANVYLMSDHSQHPFGYYSSKYRYVKATYIK